MLVVVSILFRGPWFLCWPANDLSIGRDG